VYKLWDGDAATLKAPTARFRLQQVVAPTGRTTLYYSAQAFRALTYVVSCGLACKTRPGTSPGVFPPRPAADAGLTISGRERISGESVNQEALLPSEGFTRRFTRFSIIGLVIFFVGAYAIVLYNRIGCGCAHHLTEGQPAADGTTVTIDLEELQSVKGTLNANVTLSPGRPGLLDPATGLKEASVSRSTPRQRRPSAPGRRAWCRVFFLSR
jgi:Domain of unknown function (DUF4436)